MPTIVLIGAGSAIFARNLLGDILSHPELRRSELVLHDIDPERLSTTEVVAHKVAEAWEAEPTIRTTTDRRAALADADYVLCTIQVGGYRPATVIDFDVPTRHGLRQTIGDTLGVGGIMRGLRTIPVLLDICADMEDLCPDALFINYANPMCMNMWAVDRATSIRSVGLCHSIPSTVMDLAEDVGVDWHDVRYRVAGINHLAFFLSFETMDGVDLYPRIRELAAQGYAPTRPWRSRLDGVRYELCRRFGYFVTESSEHLSEYTPWFIKRDRPDLLERYRIPLDEWPARCEELIEGWEDQKRSLETEPVEANRSLEYASRIIHSIETGRPRTVYGNVPNNGLIDNLPPGCCVEVPCLVDRNGLQPTRIGALPPQVAALIQTNVNVQALTVEAALTGRRDHVHQAAMLDPHTAAELDLEQIAELVDELVDAHGEWIPPLR